MRIQLYWVCKSHGGQGNQTKQADTASTHKLKNVELRPAVHSDFIWIIRISFLKFSEIQITWLQNSYFFGFDFYIK